MTEHFKTKTGKTKTTSITPLAIVIIVGVLLISVSKHPSESQSSQKKEASALQVQNNNENGNSVFIADNTWVSQKFVTTSAFDVTSIGLMIEKVGDPYNIHVEIQHENGTYIGASDMLLSTVATGKHVEPISFSGRLDASATYTLSVSAFTAPPTGVKLYYTTQNTYPVGAMSINWTSNNNNDLFFTITGDSGVSCACSTGACCVNSCDYASVGAQCGNYSYDCDSLDTACRNYHPVNEYCSGSSADCTVHTCDDYTNVASGTVCGSGMTCDGAGTCITASGGGGGGGCPITYAQYEAYANAWVSCQTAP